MGKLSATAGLALAVSSVATAGQLAATQDATEVTEAARAPDPGPNFTVLHAFDAAAGDIPESITTDRDGNLYISVGKTIRRRSVDGTLSVFATLPLEIFSLGLKVGSDGCVYNVSTSLTDVPGAFVWRVCEADQVEQFAELDQSGGPNDLAFDRQGDLYVTDPRLGRVWKIDSEGQPSVWLEDALLTGDPASPALVFSPLGVNGIAFQADGRTLLLSNTDRGTILRARPRGNQSPALSVFVEDVRLRGADGIALDRRGTLFVNVNATDTFASVSPAGSLRILAQGGLLDAPSSVVFGATEQDRFQMYVSSSAFSRTFGLQVGDPHPALLVTPVQAPGLPL